MRPVHLDRLLAETEVDGDDLVGVAAHDQLHHLTLPGRQAGHPGGDLGPLGLGPAALPVDLERLPDPVEEKLAADRLLEEVDRAGAHGARGGRHVAVAADHDDGKLRLAGDELVLEVDAAQPGHPEVDHEAPRSTAVLRLKEIIRYDVAL